MTPIDRDPSENDREPDGAPPVCVIAALEKSAETERLCAAARQALRMLETTGLAPITAALLRAALKDVGGPIGAGALNRRLRHGVPVREARQCPI